LLPDSEGEAWQCLFVSAHLGVL